MQFNADSLPASPVYSTLSRRLSLYRPLSLVFLTITLFQLSACGISSLGRLPEQYQKRPVYHTVRPGETLYRIATTYGVSHPQLALLNGIHDPRGLRAGARLFVGYHIAGTTKTSLRAAPKSRGVTTNNGRVEYVGGRLQWPVQGGRLTSTFGRRWGKHHDGIDIAAKRGTPVFAAHSALVVYSGNGLSGYGNLLILRAKDGLTTVYAHNRRLLVKTGKFVKKGERIAEVGSTGRSTGPHLHFEVRMKDRGGRYVAVDPLPLLKANSKEKPRYRQNESLTPILAKAERAR